MANKQAIELPGTVLLGEKKVVLGAADGLPQQTFQFLPRNLVVHIAQDGTQHSYRWKRRGWRVLWFEIAGAFEEPAVEEAMAERLDLACRMMNYEKNRAIPEATSHRIGGQKNGKDKRT